MIRFGSFVTAVLMDQRARFISNWSSAARLDPYRFAHSVCSHSIRSMFLCFFSVWPRPRFLKLNEGHSVADEPRVSAGFEDDRAFARLPYCFQSIYRAMPMPDQLLWEDRGPLQPRIAYSSRDYGYRGSDQSLRSPVVNGKRGHFHRKITPERNSSPSRESFKCFQEIEEPECSSTRISGAL